jgi:hypothetical protein
VYFEAETIEEAYSEAEQKGADEIAREEWRAQVRPLHQFELPNRVRVVEYDKATRRKRRGGKKFEMSLATVTLLGKQPGEMIQRARYVAERVYGQV